jgi:RNA polymerase sigma-70 factor (ECF subfamily)
MGASEETSHGDRLLADARAGSPEALGYALEACRRYLLLVAERELGGDLRAKAGASDLVQDTFLEAQREFARFRGRSRGELRIWLRRILLNNVGNFTRQYRETAKRAVTREIGLSAFGSQSGAGGDLAGSTASPSRRIVAHEEAEALRAAVERLPDDYRRVIELRYYRQLAFEQIGEEMGRSPEAARKLWVRALDCLREEWQRNP